MGRHLTAVHRRGKSMWCDTSGGGPVLGIHLGMSGKIVVVGAGRAEVDGGDYWERGRAAGDHRFTRFALSFADGGACSSSTRGGSAGSGSIRRSRRSARTPRR